jgi:hypothetical protein
MIQGARNSKGGGIEILFHEWWDTKILRNGRRCRLPLYWDEVGEKQLLESEMVQDTHEKIAFIRQRMMAAYSCWKSYVGNRRQELQFEVGNKVS